ncbi:MAG TPA: rRNA maturation RNase YbeY [Gemmatimonadaceae bacterium]|nr:rRNA maturation RNase YbeY [Gemmatimonadaceae bacterium]
MSLSIDVSSEVPRAPVSAARIRDIATEVLKAERIRDAMLSIALVSSRHIARLNERHLAHAGPTDVISFALGNVRGNRAREVIVGDIYIAPDVARANATRLGSGIREELARLVVHGVLHVLGHEHPDGEDRMASPMWRRQERLLDRVSAKGIVPRSRR